jgi:hypothetical protein
MDHLASAPIGKVGVFVVFYDNAHECIIPNIVVYVNRVQERNKSSIDASGTA